MNLTTQITKESDYYVAVQQLYVGYFGRPADPTGLVNFARSLLEMEAPTTVEELTALYHAGNAKVRALIETFGNSDESKALYKGDTKDFVTSIYRNVLNREPDTEGLDFWLNAIDKGVLTRSNASASIMAGAQNNTSDQGKIDANVVLKKIEASQKFTSELISSGLENKYKGDAAAEVARDMLAKIDNSSLEVNMKEQVQAAVIILVGENSGGTGGSASTSGPAAPTFTVTNNSGTLAFGGTATGDITFTVASDGTATFTRGGVVASTTVAVSAITSAGDSTIKLGANVSNISLANAAAIVNIVGYNANGKTYGLEDTVDKLLAEDVLNGHAAGSVLGDATEVAIAGNEAGTLTVQQQADLAALTTDDNWSYSIADTAVNLLARAADAEVLTKAEAVTVIGNAAGALAIADVANLAARTGDNNWSYSIRDTAVNLLAQAADAEVLTKAEVVTVIGGAAGELAIADVAKLAARTDDDNWSYSIRDTLEHIIDPVNNPIVEGHDTVITSTVSVAQIKNVDEVNGSGSVSYLKVEDTAQNLFADAGKYLKNAIDKVTISDPATIQQLNAISGWTDAALVYSIIDTYIHIGSASSQMLEDATTVKLGSYALGEVNVQAVQKLLDNKSYLSDANNDTFELSDLTFTLKDTSANLSSFRGDTENIVKQASSVAVNNGDNANASVSQAKVIYDRDNSAVYDIKDTASWLATDVTYDAAIKAAGDLRVTGTATAAQAAVIYNRDGLSGDVIYDIRDSYNNLIYASDRAAVSYANVITADVNFSWGSGREYAVALYDLAATPDVNGTAKLIMGDLYYDTVADWKNFIVTANHPAVSGSLEYTYKVYDNVTNVLAAAGNADLAILSGATEVNVSGNLSVSGAETLWNALKDTSFAELDGVYSETYTAGKITYGVSDTIANLTNAKVKLNSEENTAGDQGGVANADYLYVFDTIENVDAAQVGSDSTIGSNDLDVFRRIEELSRGGITATGSNTNDFAAGSKHSDSMWGGEGNDTIYGNGGADSLYGGNGNDSIYGGDGRDTIYAGTGAGTGTGVYYRSVNDRIYGGAGGDNMYGSGVIGDYDRDQFIYSGSSRAELINESGTYTTNRDYISNFGLGDSIAFANVSNVQFFGSGSANAQAVTSGMLAISVRYEKNQQVMNWSDSALVVATKVSIDIANSSGQFDDVADMHIIIVGSDIDLNWNGSSLAFGG